MDLTEVIAGEGRWIATEAGFDRVERRKRFSEGLDDPKRGSFVADAGGRIVGSAGVGRDADAIPAELGMMVLAEWRGKGIGTGLLEACIEWARSSGTHKITLEVWPHNEAAIGLYRKFGFVQEGYQTKHYRRRNGELWDSITMGLLL